MFNRNDRNAISNGLAWALTGDALRKSGERSLRAAAYLHSRNLASESVPVSFEIGTRRLVESYEIGNPTKLERRRLFRSCYQHDYARHAFPSMNDESR